MAISSYEVVFSGTLAGQFVQTVQHVQATIATPTNSFAQALLIAQDINTGGTQSGFMDCLPDVYRMTSIRVRQILPTGGATAILTAGDLTVNVGARSGGISAAQVNPLMIWIPTVAPNKTGRLFFPGVSEDDIDDMVLDAPLITAYQAFAQLWIDGGTLGGVDEWHGAVLRKSAPPPPIVPVSTDLIAFGQISPLIGTQRRRLRPV